MSFWVVGAAIAGPMISGAMGADAAGEGLAAQTEAARLSDATQREIAAKTDATQRYMYDTNRADNSPFLQTGTAASRRLAMLMGLTPDRSVGAAPQSAGLTADQIRAQLLPQYTKQIAAVAGTPATATPHPGRGADEFEQWVYSGGTNATPASTQIDEAGLNAAIQAQLAQQSQQSQSSLAQQSQSDAAASSDPAFGSLTRKFGASDLAGDLVYQNGLQFGLDEGRKGIERQQQASGSLLSGATLKQLSRFGNDYATTKTAGAYDRFNIDNTNLYNRLAGLAGSGQTASGQIGAAGQNYANSSTAINTNLGNNLSSTAQGLGNARAASGIAGSNAIGGGLQGAFSNYQSGELLKKIQGSPNWSLNSGGGYQTGSGTMSELSSYGVF